MKIVVINSKIFIFVRPQ